MAKTIYFVVGEASADNHGAALMRALRKLNPDLRFIGRGGPQMKGIAGADFQNWIDQSGVLGLWEVIKHYPFFRKQFHETLREIENEKPDLIVLIDYPGFNLRLARALHQKSQKIVYYISPQVWAWNRGRIKKMARWIDLMLCIFPFEAELYNQSGLRTVFVGHPMLERLGDSAIKTERDRSLIGLFPGSRSREVKKILPIMLQTAHELVRQKLDLHFEIAAASPEIAREIEHILAECFQKADGLKPSSFQIKLGDTNAIMQRAFVGIVASGSATLEAAYFRLPFVLVYKVSLITYLVGRLLVRVKYLGMPNVLASREVVPEFIQHQAKPNRIASAVLRLVDDSDARQNMISAFNQVVGSLGEPGASERAARAIINELA